MERERCQANEVALDSCVRCEGQCRAVYASVGWLELVAGRNLTLRVSRLTCVEINHARWIDSDERLLT